MSSTKTAPNVDLDDFVSEVVGLYPAKVAKKRRKHMVVREPGEEGKRQQIEANVRTVPGIITQRGCCYAGCKGVVIGPTGNMVNIVHGPVGCSFYAWMTRRNLYRPREDGLNFITYCFTTDMQDEDVIFGGEKKLRQAIREAWDLFHPPAMSLFATCPVGLIGDDVNAVAREMSAELGIPIMGFACEGYKGVSQSAGHHIANNKLFETMIGRTDVEAKTPYTINVLGEYNIGGDAWEIERVLKKCGIEVTATFSGDIAVEDMSTAHNANLNLVMCHRSINYLAEMMEKKFGIPWIKVNFIGVEQMAKSMRKIAKYFDDPALTAKVEAVIAEEESAALAALAPYRARLQGRTAMLFVGGSRAHHYQHLFRDLGMETVAAGYEFAHRDDYEGRHVIPTLQVDADSRNIEELKVGPDATRYAPRLSAERHEELSKEGLLGGWGGMWEDMGANTLVIDDVSHLELDKLIERLRPDIICSGVKDKYVIEKYGIPCKQLHNYDYSGPYAGFKGAINFAKEVDMMIHNPVWKLVKAPWEIAPTLTAELGDK